MVICCILTILPPLLSLFLFSPSFHFSSSFFFLSLFFFFVSLRNYIHVVVMGNVFSSPMAIHECYDLKGSWYSFLYPYPPPSLLSPPSPSPSPPLVFIFSLSLSFLLILSFLFSVLITVCRVNRSAGPRSDPSKLGMDNDFTRKLKLDPSIKAMFLDQV